MRLRALSVFAAIAALIVAVTASAADWPTRPVKFIVTLGPSSGTDIGARLLADRLTQRWGQPVIVENRPGGGRPDRHQRLRQRPRRSRAAVRAVVVVHGASVPARQSAL
jgi:hypothetical protein